MARALLNKKHVGLVIPASDTIPSRRADNRRTVADAPRATTLTVIAHWHPRDNKLLLCNDSESLEVGMVKPAKMRPCVLESSR